MDSSYRKRVERLEASEGSGIAAKVRAAAEQFAEKWGIDLASQPGAKDFLEGEFRAGRINLDGGLTWEQFVRVFDHLGVRIFDPTRGGA